MSLIVPSLPAEPGPQLACGPWATSSDVCGPCSDVTIDGTILDDCLDAATDLLFAMSGRQWPGLCEQVVRPSARPVYGDGGRPIHPWSTSPAAWYASWGYCTHDRPSRGCGSTQAVELSGWPLAHVDQVIIDGQIVPPDRYRIDDRRWLVRLPDPDGSRPGWPRCQDLGLPPTAKGTWQVTISAGRLPPPMARRACAALACQLALACDPATAGKCRLPQRAVSQVRQGVQTALQDPTALLDSGRFGIVEVDAFLVAANPKRLMAAASVVSPDGTRRATRSR